MGELVQQRAIDSSGHFEFRDLQPQRYYVLARAASYQPSTRTPIDLSMIPQQSVQLMLQPSTTAPSQQSSAPGGLVGTRTLAIPAKAKHEFTQAQGSLEKKGDQPGAIAHLEKAMGIYPEYVEAYHLLGTVYMDQGKWPEAEKLLRRALELNQRFAPSYFALGALLNKQHNPREAVNSLLKGLELEPDFWPGHAEICQAYFALGDRQRAKEHAIRAHELKPEAAVTHLILADSYFAENSYKEAKTEYEHFLERAPKSPWTSKIEERIHQLDRALAQAQHSQAPTVPK
jgi:tetratricopeptide (TPR) repeat protein